VLDDKQWTKESMLLLVSGLMISISMVGLIGHQLQGASWAQEIPEVHRDFLLSTLGFHVASLIFVHFFIQANQVSWKSFVGCESARIRGMWLVTLGILAMALPVSLGLNYVSALTMTWLELDPEQQMAVQILQETKRWDELLVFGTTAIVLAPVVEEILFRGILYRFIKQRAPASFALWMSSLLFATIHANAVTFIPLTFFAITLVWTYEKTRTLLAPILAHALFNAVNFVMLIFSWDPIKALES
jgi:membrane protease YdiL (CAAX protease family)